MGGGTSTAEKPEGQQVSNAKEEIAPAQPEEEPKKRPRDRQEKILRRYNEGWTKVKIAQDLGIGLSTVNYHIQALRDKGKI